MWTRCPRPFATWPEPPSGLSSCFVVSCPLPRSHDRSRWPLRSMRLLPVFLPLWHSLHVCLSVSPGVSSCLLSLCVAVGRLPPWLSQSHLVSLTRSSPHRVWSVVLSHHFTEREAESERALSPRPGPHSEAGAHSETTPLIRKPWSRPAHLPGWDLHPQPHCIPKGNLSFPLAIIQVSG